MTSAEIIRNLKSQANRTNVAGMARFGINSNNTLGVSIPVLRAIAKEIKKDHPLSLELWRSGIHEARILASLIDDPKLVASKQMDQWVSDFDSWDVCDQVCSNLFDKTPFAYEKVLAWTGDEREFVKRAGFVLIAALAVHDKKASDQIFIDLFPILKQGSTDPRNYVKKAVNWALRQMGKRNLSLHPKVLQLAQDIELLDSPAAHWIARDALRELTHPKTLQRVHQKRQTP